MVDSTPPGAVTALTATWNDADDTVDLMWTNPTDEDLAGVIIASGADEVAGSPEPGSSYAVGDDLPGGGRVVYVGTDASTVDATPVAGNAVYHAWAFDDAANYSADFAEASTAVPALQIDVSDPANPSATATGHPEGYLLTATASLRPATALASEGQDGELLFTATMPGAAGNGITVDLVDGDDGATLAVATVGNQITVTYDRDLHTAQEIVDLIAADVDASALVTASAALGGTRIEGQSSFTLAGGSDDALRISLALTNDGPRIVFQPKALPAITGAVITGRFAIGDQAAAYFGPAGLDSGATATGYFDIENFTALAGPIIEADLPMQEDASVFVNGSWDDAFVAVDSSGSGAAYTVGTEALSYKGFAGDTFFRNGVVSADGRMMYMGHRNMPMVVGVDLTTLRPVSAVDLDDGTGVGFVDSVVASPDMAYLYAVVTYGSHAYGNSAGANGDVNGAGFPETVELVKLDMEDLSEVARLTLVTDAPDAAKGRGLGISADGSVGAMALLNAGRVEVIDLETMTSLQSVDTSAVSRMPRLAAVSPDGLSTYVAFVARPHPVDVAAGVDVNDGTLQVIDNATGTMTALAPPEVVDANRPGFLAFGPDGLLYYGRKVNIAGLAVVGSPVDIYDMAAASWTSPDSTLTQAHGIAFSADGATRFLVDRASERLHVTDVPTDVDVVEPIAIPAGFGHTVITTPF